MRYHRLRDRTAFALFAAIVAGPAVAQSSASFELVEHQLNASGTPHAAIEPSSASFSVSLSSLGEFTLRGMASSAAFDSDVGFTVRYRPPGEIAALTFEDSTTISWSGERSAGTFNIYRENLQNLSGGNYGQCLGGSLVQPTLVEPDLPPLGQGFFYLASVRNRLLEEGTLGTDSLGSERTNATPCP